MHYIVSQCITFTPSRKPPSRPIQPNSFFTALLSFCPAGPKPYFEVLTLHTPQRSIKLALTGQGLPAALTINPATLT